MADANANHLLNEVAVSVSPIEAGREPTLGECAAELELWRADTALSAEQLREHGDMPHEAEQMQRLAGVYALAIRCVRAVEAIERYAHTQYAASLNMHLTIVSWRPQGEAMHFRARVHDWPRRRVNQCDSAADAILAAIEAASPPSPEGR
jgi:hypothetical protein